MKITKQDVEHVAKLSRLELSGEEKERMIGDLNLILDLADKLTEVDVDKVEPTAHVLSLKNVFRDDSVQPSLDKEEVLSNAPDQQEGMFRVPRIIGNDES